MDSLVPVKGKLILTIINSRHTNSLVNKTKEVGATGSTVMLGRGNLNRPFLHALGLDDVEKEIILTLAVGDELEPIIDVIKDFRRHKKSTCGVSMVIDVYNILRHNLLTGESKLDQQRSSKMDSPHTLITCIVNKGVADEVMDAARKAGATGGTIVNARGTGKEEDVKFFGIQLVPEKEMLLILVGSGLTGEVLEAIRVLPCLAEPGSGIAYCTDVERFMTLGGRVTPTTE